MFDGFTRERIATDGAAINLVRAGGGPPVLLLHGYPQTHVMWHKVAPRLAERFTVVVPDLRGYGDSDKPEPAGDYSNYCKRVMAQDQVTVMAALGFERFSVIGHDRGARVGYRMAYDHPDRVARLGILDVITTADIFARVDQALARAYFHWFLMLQPAPLAETFFGADPEFYVRWLIDRWCSTPGAITDAAFAEYIRCFSDPATIQATCADYRAAPIDIAHDEADRARKITCPVLLLWGAGQTQHPGWPSMQLDNMGLWREIASDVRGGPLDCGHFLPEEAPDETVAALNDFLS